MQSIGITCNNQYKEVESIKTDDFIRYIKQMRAFQNNESINKIEVSKKVVGMIFNLNSKEIDDCDLEDLLSTAEIIHFIMQEIVVQEFTKIENIEPTEIEVSAFDEYDRENGYVEEETQSFFDTCLENINAIVRFAVKTLNNSLDECMKSNVITLVEFVRYEMENKI